MPLITSPFALPKGKILVLLPTFRDGQTGRLATSTKDSEAASVLAAKLEASGRREGRDWQRRAVDTPLSAEDRRQNLIILCGSNMAFEGLLTAHPSFLGDVTYAHSRNAANRTFSWEGRTFHSSSTRDFALLAVRENPYNLSRRIIVLVGLRSSGTLAAARIFADDSYANLRRESAKRAHGGELVSLFHVSLPTKGKSSEQVRLAVPSDGSAPQLPKLLPIPTDLAGLRQILMSLRENPRRSRVSDFVYELSVTKEYDVSFHEEFSWEWDGSDIVIQFREFSSNVELNSVEGINFSAKPLDGRGKIEPLAAINEPQRKSYLLFLIPPIVKGDKPRRFSLEARWPGAASRLRALNSIDDNSITLPHATAPIDRFTFRLKFEAPGAKFLVTPLFPVPAGTPLVCDRKRPFEYVAHNVAPRAVYKVSVERIK